MALVNSFVGSFNVDFAVSSHLVAGETMLLRPEAAIVVVVDRLIGSLVSSLDVDFVDSFVVGSAAAVFLQPKAATFQPDSGISLVWYLLVVGAGNTDNLNCSTR